MCYNDIYSGGFMVKEKLQQLINENGKVSFKLYSLEYTIVLDDNQYIIYANSYMEKQFIYKSLKELLNNYLVYNESIMSNIDKIILIEK